MMTFKAFRQDLDEGNKTQTKEEMMVIRHTLTHPYTDDDDNPDTRVFYDTLVDQSA